MTRLFIEGRHAEGRERRPWYTAVREGVNLEDKKRWGRPQLVDGVGRRFLIPTNWQETQDVLRPGERLFVRDRRRPRGADRRTIPGTQAMDELYPVGTRIELVAAQLEDRPSVTVTILEYGFRLPTSHTYTIRVAGLAEQGELVRRLLAPPPPATV